MTRARESPLKSVELSPITIPVEQSNYHGGKTTPLSGAYANAETVKCGPLPKYLIFYLKRECNSRDREFYGRLRGSLHTGLCEFTIVAGIGEVRFQSKRLIELRHGS